MSTYEALLRSTTAASTAASAPAFVSLGAPAPAAPGDPDVTAAQTQMQIDPSFEGADPKAYRVFSTSAPIVDATSDFTGSQKWLSGETAMVSLTPLYFNAPAFYKSRTKTSATIALSTAQSKPQTPLDKQLRWTMLAPLLTAEKQDIESYDFSRLDEDVRNALQNAPMPGGSGTLTLTLTAITGGTPSKVIGIISDTFGKLRKIADPSVNPIISGLGVPAAALATADQYDALVNQIVQAFSPGAQRELTFNASPIDFAVLSSAAEDGIVQLPAGRSYLVVIPVHSNLRDQIDGASDAVAAYQDLIDAEVTAKTMFTLVLPQGNIRADGSKTNPFENIPYVTIRCDILQAKS